MVRVVGPSVIAIAAVVLSCAGSSSAAPETAAPRGKWTLLPLPLAYNVTQHLCTWASSASLPSLNSSSPRPPAHPITLVIGGTEKYSRRPLRHINAYDYTTQTVTKLQPGPLPMQQGASAVVNGVLYVYQPSYFNQDRVPGYENTTILTFELKSNTWGQIPILDTAVRPSRDAAGDLVQWFPDRKKENLVLYQCDGIWSFNLKTKVWSAVEVKGERPPCLSGAAIAGPDDSGEEEAAYLVGGTTDDGVASSSVWKYTFKSRTWSRLNAVFPLAVTELSAAVDAQTLYAFGGWNVSSDDVFDKLYSLRLDRPRAEWREVQASPRPVRRFGSCILGQRGGRRGVLLFGGIEQPVPDQPRFTGNDIWSFSPY